MKCVYMLAILVAMAAAVMGATKEISQGAISASVNSMGGGIVATATGTAKKDKDDDADDNSSSENNDDDDSNDDDDAAVTTVEPATEAPSRKKRDTDAMTSKVTITLASLKEINSEGAVIGEERDIDKAFADITKAEFTLMDVKEDQTLMYSKNKDDQPIKTKSVTYEKSFGSDNSGKIQVVLYIATEAGNITLDNERAEVKEGQIKFTVHMEGWTFCTADSTDCADKVGKFLDFEIHVEGKGEAEAVETGENEPVVFNIGDSNLFSASKMIMHTKNDDSTEWLKMSEGYPKYEKAGDNKSKFVMRFPAFMKSIWYDPHVRMTVPGDDTVGAASAVTGSLLAILMAAIFAAVLRY